MTSVVVFVFDGLQPAQVNPRLMPNLSGWAAGGVTCANHHSGFPTVTRVNVSSIVTGLNPGGHGLAGNGLVVRDFDPEHAIPALEPELTQIAKSGAPVGQKSETPCPARVRRCAPGPCRCAFLYVPTWNWEMCALMLASASCRRTWLPPPPRSRHS